MVKTVLGWLRIGCAAVGIAAIVLTARGLAAEPDIDAAFRAVAAYRDGDDRQPLYVVEQLVRRAASVGDSEPMRARVALADRMVSLLTSADATATAKAFACGQLAAIGTEKHAPALASLLTVRELAAPALSALSVIPGPEVDRLLRGVLGTLQGNLRIGAIHAVGQRRDPAAVQPLAAILAGPDEASACAAAHALGQIGGQRAIIELRTSLAASRGPLRAQLAAACLNCASQLLADKQAGPAAELYGQLSRPGETPQVRMAAFRGIVVACPEKAVGAVCQALTGGESALESMAIQLVPQIPGPDATRQFAQCLGKTPAPVQPLLLGALAARRDPAACAAIEAAAASPDRAVRLAALHALGACGGETSLKTLADPATTAAGTAEGEAARSSLERLRGPRINQRLAAMLSQRDASAQVVLIRILAARNAVDSTAALHTAARAADKTVRKEAWKALGTLAAINELPALLDLLVRAGEEERDEAERAAVSVIRKPNPPDLRVALDRLAAARTAADRSALIRLLGAVGDDSALPALRQSIQSADAAERDAAVRALAAWPTASPFQDLLNLARRDAEPIHRVLALRAAIRLASKVPPERMSGSVGELMQLARNTAERKAVLAELGRCPTIDSLRLAQKHLGDPQLATEAGVAAIQIASALRDTHCAEVLAALQPLLTASDAAVASGALKVLRDILKPVNLARGATASSPDGLDSDGSSGGDPAAIDGDPNTFWDEVDGAEQYRLKVTLRGPAEVSSLHIAWHPYEQHQARNFDVLCDGKVVKEVRGARCFEHQMFLVLPPTRCTSLELVIPGRNGLVSPCIHELEIFAGFPPGTTHQH